MATDIEEYFKNSDSTMVVCDHPSSKRKVFEVAVSCDPGKQIGIFGNMFLNRLRKHPSSFDYANFIREHDGCSFGLVSEVSSEPPLLSFVKATDLESFSNKYKENGERAWIIDLNKSKSLYRSSDSWIAFAQVERGPACLTMFLEGENSGKIFLATPQPWFNILKPIAQDFPGLLARMAKDLAAFFYLLRATFVVVNPEDHQRYGYYTVEYKK